MQFVEKQLDDLVEKGKEQGWLTYAEVNSYLPDEATSAQKLDELLVAIDRAGIELVDHPPEGEKEKKASGTAGEAAVEYTVKPSDDPIRMYLSQMAEIPLLSRDEEISLAREALGWTSEPFDIPSDILDSWRMAGLKHVSERKSWQERLDAQDSEVSNRFTRVVSGDLPTRLEKAVQKYKQSLAENPSKLATRKSSEDALKAIVPTVPEMIGGSADLTGSNNTRTPEQEAVSADNYGGSFIHYGIREFGMAAVMNGMALHGGFIPYSGTFLVFSDYSRPALRLAALMEQRVIHVLTHDSIGLGEDGPTHQPVEHLAALRAIPNLLTLRPADATETLECWQIALEQSRTPSAMALTRQGLPAVRLEYSEKNLSAKGAYELASAEGDALVTLLATGSEVHLAIEAKQQLEAENIGTRVISMPCFELFDKQKSSYRDDVLGNTTVRIAIEAAIRQGWDAYLRPGDGFIGMESFGASAPADRLFEHFGITVDTIVKNVKDRLDT